MTTKKQTDTSALFKPIGRFFYRFHVTVFTVVTIAGLAYAVYSLYTLVTTTIDAETPTTGTPLETNPATTSQLQSLYTPSNAPSSVPLPPCRTNPFGE